jgi:hypothetical protein
LQKQVENSWPAQMKKEDITLLEVVWYETFNDETKGIPTAVEGQVSQDFFDQNGRLPTMECSILEHFILYIYN